MYTLVCQNPSCGNEFEASRKDAKYCHKNCRNAHYRLRRKRPEMFGSPVAQSDAEIQREIALLQETNNLLKQKIVVLEEEGLGSRFLSYYLDTLAEKITDEIVFLDSSLRLSDLEFYNEFLNVEVKLFREAIENGTISLERFLRENPFLTRENYIRSIYSEEVPGGPVFRLRLLEERVYMRKRLQLLASRFEEVAFLVQLTEGELPGTIEEFRSEILANERRISALRGRLG